MMMRLGEAGMMISAMRKRRGRKTTKTNTLEETKQTQML